MISPQQGHIDVGLSNVSVMYTNAGFVAERVLQPIPVQKQSDKIWEWSPDNLRQSLDGRAPAALSNQLEVGLSASGSYYCDGHALHDWVPDETDENVDAPIDPQVDMTTLLTDNIMLNKEIATVAAIYAAMNAASLVTDLSDSAYANAWDTTGIDPISAIDVAKETVLAATGKMPRSMVMSRSVFRGVRNNPTVKARVSGALNGIDKTLISAQQLAAACDLDEIIIGDAVVNTAAAGLAASNSLVWGKYAMLFYKPQAPGLRTVALGYMMKWMQGKLASLVYTDYSKRRHATWIEVQQYYAPAIIAAPAGVMWKNTTQN